MIKIPYIEPQMRNIFDTYIEILANLIAKPGELNYVITKLIHEYLGSVVEYLGTDFHYIDLNEVVGVLECAKQELYRQIAAKYEDVKKNEHGSISELDKEN